MSFVDEWNNIILTYTFSSLLYKYIYMYLYYVYIIVCTPYTYIINNFMDVYFLTFIILFCLDQNIFLNIIYFYYISQLY